MQGKKIKLIITVDCGTVSYEPLAAAKRIGFDTIVVDHHIGGEHIPLNTLSQHDFSPFDKDQQLIFYCQVGARSAAAVQLMRKMGFKNSISLRGGLNGMAG